MEQSRSEKSPGSTSCGGGQQGANGKLMSQQCELQKSESESAKSQNESAKRERERKINVIDPSTRDVNVTTQWSAKKRKK